MSTFALVHGGGGSAWDWHLVEPELSARGHDPVAVDLPSEGASAGWSDYADTVVEAIGDRTGVVVVGHSLGGFTAPLVAARIPVELLVFLAGMVPAPGELFSDWWTNTGYEPSGREDVFYHDVSPELAAEAQTRERDESSSALEEPWPLDSTPGGAHALCPLPRRPYVPGRLGATPRARTARDRGGRDRRRPLRHAQPSRRARRPLDDLRFLTLPMVGLTAPSVSRSHPAGRGRAAASFMPE